MNDMPVERGVYTLPYLSSCGRVMLVAINEYGREVERMIVPDGESKSDAASRLRKILDGKAAPTENGANKDGPTFTIKARGVKHAITKLIALAGGAS